MEENTMTLDIIHPSDMTLSIGREARPRLAGDISSLHNSLIQSPPYPSDTVSIPTVGIYVKEGAAQVVIETAEDMSQTKWLQQTITALIQLIWLPPDWSSDRPKKIETKAIENMLGLLLAILDPDTIPPAVVPTRQGGVQVEWHQNGIDLEIKALPAGQLEFFVSGSENEFEGPIERDLAVLGPFVHQLKSATAL